MLNCDDMEVLASFWISPYMNYFYPGLGTIFNAYDRPMLVTFQLPKVVQVDGDGCVSGEDENSDYDDEYDSDHTDVKGDFNLDNHNDFLKGL